MLDDSASASQGFWEQITQAGWLALMIPEKYGGLASDTFDLALLMEEMGRRLAPGAFFSTAVLAAGALERIGTGEARLRHEDGVMMCMGSGRA